MLATQLNPLVEEERLSSNCICQINRFIVNTLKDGRYVVFFFFLVFIYSFLLVAPGLSCNLRGKSWLQHAGSGSLARDWTPASCVGSAEVLDHQGGTCVLFLTGRWCGLNQAGHLAHLGLCPGEPPGPVMTQLQLSVQCLDLTSCPCPTWMGPVTGRVPWKPPASSPEGVSGWDMVLLWTPGASHLLTWDTHSHSACEITVLGPDL